MDAFFAARVTHYGMFACNRYLLLMKLVPNLLVITGYDFTENSRISIDAHLDVALIDLPWNPNLAVEGSQEYNDLVDVFNNQVGFGFCSGTCCFTVQLTYV